MAGAFQSLLLNSDLIRASLRCDMKCGYRYSSIAVSQFKFCFVVKIMLLIFRNFFLIIPLYHSNIMEN